MTSQPWWRQAVDAAEESIGPRIDGFLRSDAFAQLLRTSLELRATTLRRIEPYSRTLLHALNLPTASDVRMIRRQVANLERQLTPTEPPSHRRGAPAGPPMDHQPGPALADRARAAGGRSLRRATNGLRLWTNVDPPEVGATPRAVVWRRYRCELWRYAGHPRPDRAPVLIVPSVLNRSRILDLQPRTSLVRNVLDADLDAFMLDWGEPDEGDADRDLAGYVDLLRAAIATTLDVSGATEVVLLGYCMGGLLSLLATADQPELPVRGVLALTTPVAVSELGFLIDVFDKGMRPSHVIDDRGLVPAERIAQAFRLIRPSGVLLQRAELWQHLWNDEFLATYRAIAGWVNDPIPMSGALFSDWIALARSPDVAEGRYRLGDRVVALRDVTCPVLSVVAEADSFVPRAATDPLLELVGSVDKQELEVPGGHIGVIVGRRAQRTIARMVEWLEATAAA